MSALPPTPPTTGSPARKRRVVVFSLLLLLAIAALFYPQAFSIKRIAPAPNTTWLLFLLTGLSFLGVLVLTLVLLRQVVKLYAERRANVLGSKFKTKLVVGALGLSLIPVVCMFAFTYGLINRTLEKWFSRPVEVVRDDTRELARLLEVYIRQNARAEARTLARDPALISALQSSPVRLPDVIQRYHPELQGGFILLLNRGGAVRRAFNAPADWRSLTSIPMAAGRANVILSGTPYDVAVEPISGSSGSDYIAVALPVPQRLTARLQNLRRDYATYRDLAIERHRLRLLYTFYLLLLTLAILFAATWSALFLSKMVTVPIQALGAATGEISRGNLAHRVEVPAQDELRTLVESFNRMAVELQHNRAEIERSRSDLQEANAELELRQQHMETLLESIPSAVISLSHDGAIERTNPAVWRMFGGEAARATRLNELFNEATQRELRHLIRKAARWGVAAGQIELPRSRGAEPTPVPQVTAVTVASIGQRPASPGWPSRRGPLGYVLVFEDLTEVLRVQKLAAWREVARRIAHEIKNPLTPIALSAQRIQRRVARLLPNTSSAELRQTLDLASECAGTIEHEAKSLQHLVSEFTAFARFPAARKVTADMNEIIERALRVFEGRLDGIQVRTALQPVPPLALDPEEIKRVLVNLIDNAAEALHDCTYREILLATAASDGLIEVLVADTGPGIPADDKERLFLPYYSTKQRGTGLGLAIVAQIMQEHGGSIRVENNEPMGTRFILEFPIVCETAISAPPGEISGGGARQELL